MLLTGDVGATKTALAVIESPEEARSSVMRRTYETTDWDDLVPLVSRFLEEQGLDRVDRAAFGVPGPVVDGEARLTNVPWHVGAERLHEELPLGSVVVVNDLEAIAQAVPDLRGGEDLATLREGDPVRKGTIGVVAPGTGLGEAFLTWDGRGYRAHASEGGHTDFAPANGVQRELLDHLSRRMAHVSYERVCSGSAVPGLYAFLRDSGRADEPRWLAERLREADDPTAVIFEEGARDDGCGICRAAVSMFVEILGAEVGNFALSLFATGGLYLAGGIPPRIVPRLREDRFLDAVLHKGRLTDSELMERLAIHVVTAEGVASLGLARMAERHDEGAGG